MSGLTASSGAVLGGTALGTAAVSGASGTVLALTGIAFGTYLVVAAGLLLAGFVMRRASRRNNVEA